MARAVGLAIPAFEKSRNTVRATLLRNVTGNLDGPWARLQGVTPFTITVSPGFTTGTTIQLYGWNGENPPDPSLGALVAVAAPLSDPILAAGSFTYCAVLDWLAAAITNGAGVTVDVMGVELETGF
jgi:hypothetical protein